MAWFVPFGKEPIEVWAEGGRVVAVLDEASCHRSRAEARLIAAAPTMRDALVLALRNAESRLYMLPVKADPTERASLEAEAKRYRDALLKATMGDPTEAGRSTAPKEDGRFRAFVRGLTEAGGDMGLTYDDDPHSPRSRAYDRGRNLGRQLRGLD